MCTSYSRITREFFYLVPSWMNAESQTKVFCYKVSLACQRALYCGFYIKFVINSSEIFKGELVQTRTNAYTAGYALVRRSKHNSTIKLMLVIAHPSLDILLICIKHFTDLTT